MEKSRNDGLQDKKFFLCSLRLLIITRDGVRHKEATEKQTLYYEDVQKELVIQNEIPIKMTVTNVYNLEANFDRKISPLPNILLEQLQNSIAKTFALAKITYESSNDDKNKDVLIHEIAILIDKVQSLEKQKSFPKKEIH